MLDRIDSNQKRKKAKRKKEKISKKSTGPSHKSRYFNFRFPLPVLTSGLHFRFLLPVTNYRSPTSGLIIFLANRESAFINSLIASGSTYEITKACHKGELKECNQCSEGEDLKKLLKPEDQILKTNSQVEQLWEYCDVPLGWFSNPIGQSCCHG